jgi:hypothetical protein
MGSAAAGTDETSIGVIIHELTEHVKESLAPPLQMLKWVQGNRGFAPKPLQKPVLSAPAKRTSPPPAPQKGGSARPDKLKAARRHASPDRHYKRERKHSRRSPALQDGCK